MENNATGTEWGKVIGGILLVFFAAGVTMVGLFATALSADGGDGPAITTLIISSLIVIALVVTGIRLVLKGIKFNISSPVRIEESKPKYTLRVLGQVLLAVLLACILRLVPSALGIGNQGLVSFFGIPLFFVSWVIYYGIINKPWSLLKKVGWIFIVFVLLQLIAYIPQLLAAAIF